MACSHSPSPKQSTQASKSLLITTATTAKPARHGKHGQPVLPAIAALLPHSSPPSCAPKRSTACTPSLYRLPGTYLNHLLHSTAQAAAHSASAFHMLAATYDSQSLQPSGAVPKPALTIFSATRAVSTLLMARMDWKGGNSLQAHVGTHAKTSDSQHAYWQPASSTCHMKACTSWSLRRAREKSDDNHPEPPRQATRCEHMLAAAAWLPGAGLIDRLTQQ
jgi:hypothetical protein